MDDVVEPGELGWIGSERTELALDPTPDDVPDSCFEMKKRRGNVSTKELQLLMSFFFLVVAY